MKAIVYIVLIVLFSIGSIVLLGAALNIAKILPMLKKYWASKKYKNPELLSAFTVR